MKIKNTFNRIKTKAFLYTTTACTILLASNNTISAADTPTFDNSAAQSAAGGFMDPLTTFLLWAIPGVAALAALFSAVGWYTKDEEEKENKKYTTKVLKPIVIVGIIAESIVVILKIVGIG